MLNLIIKHLSASIMFLTTLFSTSIVTTPAHADTVSASKHVCIDPGHQLRGNSQLEPVAPGSSTRKPKVSSGAQGVATRKNEYQLTLEVGLKLRDALQAKGYKITMIRDKNEVNISNKERAEKANDSGCDSYVRIHADGINNSSISGVSVLTASAKNRYLSPAVQKASEKLSKDILAEYLKTTGAQNRGISYRDDLTGTNWSKIPTTLIELGFMSNPAEDRKMSTKEYQDKMVSGIVNGLEKYYREK
jgi:cell wall hydrolase/autolysin